MITIMVMDHCSLFIGCSGFGQSAMIGSLTIQLSGDGSSVSSLVDGSGRRSPFDSSLFVYRDDSDDIRMWRDNMSWRDNNMTTWAFPRTLYEVGSSIAPLSPSGDPRQGPAGNT